jgi:hypothetical protein
MELQPTNDKRTNRRLIAIVAVLSVLILAIIGTLMASGSNCGPVGVIYLGGVNENHGPKIAQTNRTDKELLVVNHSVQARGGLGRIWKFGSPILSYTRRCARPTRHAYLFPHEEPGILTQGTAFVPHTP